MSTPGCRSRAASTNGSDGSIAATAAGVEPAQQLGGERARAAADVEHPLPGRHAGEVGEPRRERPGVRPHEAVVAVGGDVEHSRNLPAPARSAGYPGLRCPRYLDEEGVS